MRFFTIILLFALLLFIAPTVNHSQEITTVFSRQTSDIKLYGLPVELNTPNDISDIIAQYQYDAYPLPAAFLPYLDEIVIIEQKEIDEEFSANTSGYTRTYFLDDQYTGSTIYLSDSLFRETTLLHEALHVIDARFQFSASAQFQSCVKPKWIMSIMIESLPIMIHNITAANILWKAILITCMIQKRFSSCSPVLMILSVKQIIK